MNDEIFSRLVAEDVKNRISEAQRSYLELPQNRVRWKRALLALVNNLETQIESIESDRLLDIERYESFGEDGELLLKEAVASYDARKSKIEKFKFYVDKRLDYVASLGEQVDVSERAQFLEAAIKKHQELMSELDMEETDLDVALWASLDGKWEFDNIK